MVDEKGWLGEWLNVDVKCCCVSSRVARRRFATVVAGRIAWLFVRCFYTSHIKRMGECGPPVRVSYDLCWINLGRPALRCIVDNASVTQRNHWLTAIILATFRTAVMLMYRRWHGTNQNCASRAQSLTRDMVTHSQK